MQSASARSVGSCGDLVVNRNSYPPAKSADVQCVQCSGRKGSAAHRTAPPRRCFSAGAGGCCGTRSSWRVMYEYLAGRVCANQTPASIQPASAMRASAEGWISKAGPMRRAESFLADQTRQSRQPVSRPTKPLLFLLFLPPSSSPLHPPSPSPSRPHPFFLSF